MYILPKVSGFVDIDVNHFTPQYWVQSFRMRKETYERLHEILFPKLVEYDIDL